MSSLIVVSNPEPASLSHHVADRLAQRLPRGGVEVADLAREGFDPRYRVGDRVAYVGGEFPDDVAAEQRRIDRASDLVLVYPVYWWSMPALLKGWIDRVFANGWAFDVGVDAGVSPRLQKLTMHQIPVAGTGPDDLARYGYDDAMRTQIERGIVDFVGARRGVTAFVYESEQESAQARADAVERAVAAVSEAMTSVPARA